jgi:hypothetical protein
MLGIGSILIVLAIAFCITLYYTSVIEWIIAFEFTFHLLAFEYDSRIARIT